MKSASHWKGAAIVALLSFPFWFLTGRFARELWTGEVPRPDQNMETPEALSFAFVLALLTFAPGFIWGRTRKL
jgi:hypothetical protein